MKKVLSTVLILGLAFNMLSCSSEKEGEEYATVGKDEKAVVTSDVTQFESTLADTPDKAQALDGKVIELSGTVKKTYSISEEGDRTNGAHYIELEGEGTIPGSVTCYFGSSQESLMGKSISVKGHFKYNAKMGVGSLLHCVVL